jgi:hypothetical protein
VSTPRPRRAWSRWAAGVGLVVAAGLGLAACGDGGASSARQACGHVSTSLAIYKRSVASTDPTQAARLASLANLQLSDALGLAAQAASQNGQWQALMTTLSEQGRVPESDLVGALTAQCAVADSSNPGQPPPPTDIPPPATVPGPTTTTTSR